MSQVFQLTNPATIKTIIEEKRPVSLNNTGTINIVPPTIEFNNVETVESDPFI